MKLTPSTPLRSRTVQGDLYEAAGQADFSFSIPQPFTAEHFESLRELGVHPAGFAAQANQVLAENLGNNMAARIKKAAKANVALPTQADMDELYSSYDFTGIRSSAIAIGSLFDKIMYRLSGQFLRKLFAKKGYQDMPAPVKVAKKNAEPGDNEISYDDFETEIARLMEGDGPWAEKQAFIDVREGLIEEARAEEARIREAESATENKLLDVDL